MKIAQFFEHKARDNGATYYSVTEDRPDWLYQACMDAHDGEWPNDWRWETISDIVNMIDDGEKDSFDIADSLTDVYTTALARWLHDVNDRSAYCDDAMDEFGGDFQGVVKVLSLGQFHCIRQMADIILQAIEENEEEPDEEE